MKYRPDFENNKITEWDDYYVGYETREKAQARLDAFAEYKQECKQKAKQLREEIRAAIKKHNCSLSIEITSGDDWGVNTDLVVVFKDAKKAFPEVTLSLFDGEE